MSSAKKCSIQTFFRLRQSFLGKIKPYANLNLIIIHYLDEVDTLDDVDIEDDVDTELEVDTLTGKK